MLAKLSKVSKTSSRFVNEQKRFDARWSQERESFAVAAVAEMGPKLAEARDILRAAQLPCFGDSSFGDDLDMQLQRAVVRKVLGAFLATQSPQHLEQYEEQLALRQQHLLSVRRQEQQQMQQMQVQQQMQQMQHMQMQRQMQQMQQMQMQQMQHAQMQQQAQVQQQQQQQQQLQQQAQQMQQQSAEGAEGGAMDEQALLQQLANKMKALQK